MKIAIIGSDSADSIEFNLKNTFVFKGHECEIFDIYNKWYFNYKLISKYSKTIDLMFRKYSDRYDISIFKTLSTKIQEYSPDLVVCVYRFIHPIFVSEIKKNLKCRVIHINPDALTTFEYQQIFASDYDVWFTKDPYIVRFMKDNMHLNAKLYNEAFNKRMHKKPETDKEEYEKRYKIDVMTYGTMYPYRCNMLKQVINEGVDVKVFGVMPNRFYDHSLDKAFQNKYIVGKEKSEILYGSKIVFNQMHYAEIESVNNRFFEVNGSGAFQLSDYRPILKDLLPIDPELVSFKSIDEAIDKIKYYLNHPQQRYEIAEKIYSHFINNYSYDEMVDYVLKESFN